MVISDVINNNNIIIEFDDENPKPTNTLDTCDGADTNYGKYTQ